MTAIRDYLRQIAGYLILSVLVENLVAKKKKNMAHIFACF